MASTGGSHRRSGFTLVELLAVMAIISILAALLLPAIARSRYQARVVQCKNNLRQIGIAIQMYSNAFDGWMPVDGNSEDQETTLDRIGTNVIWNGAYPYDVTDESGGGTKLAWGHYRGLGLLTILNNQFIGDPAVLFCPDDNKTNVGKSMDLLKNHRHPDAAPSNPDDFIARCSYVYRQLGARSLDDQDKGKLGSLGNNVGIDLDDDISTTADDKPVKAIACDRNFIGMYDNTSYDYTNNYTSGEVKLNHGGTSANVLYEDGHVDTITNTFPNTMQDLRLHMEVQPPKPEYNLGSSDGGYMKEMWRIWVLLDERTQ